MHPTFDPPDELRRARRRAGLTQSELARALGTSPSHISRMETRKVPVEADMLWQALDLAAARASAGWRHDVPPPYGSYAGDGWGAAVPSRRSPSERLLALREEAAARWGVDARTVCRCPDDAPDAS